MAAELSPHVIAFVEKIIEEHNKEVKKIENDISVANENVQRLRKENSENDVVLRDLKGKIAALKPDPNELAMAAAMSETINSDRSLLISHNDTTMMSEDNSTFIKEEDRKLPEYPIYLDTIEIDAQDDDDTSRNEIIQKLKEFHNSINWSDKPINLTKAYDLTEDQKIFGVVCPKCNSKFMVSINSKPQNNRDEINTEIYENHVIKVHVF